VNIIEGVILVNLRADEGKVKNEYGVLAEDKTGES
jgi:hypothetical protein